MDRATELLRVALAVDGDAEALAELARLDRDGRIARRHRAAPTLARRARELEIEGPALDAWRRRWREVATHHMVLEETLDRTGRALHAAGVGWSPLKGIDLAYRVYDEREERPTADLDLLIAPRDLDRARQALVATGVRPLAEDWRVDLYLRQEGYAWQGKDPRGGLIELHFRFWGSAPEALATACRAASKRAGAEPSADDSEPSHSAPTPSTGPLPPGGRYLPLAHAFVVAAVHAWLDSPPRGLHAWRDLFMIARAGRRQANGSLEAEVGGLARDLGLALPVSAAAEMACRLWGDGSPAGRSCCRIARDLGSRLRLPERLFRRRWRAGPHLAEAPSSALIVARGLARRPMRHGLARLVWRRAWPHPGVVAGSTDPGWPWPLRRAWYQSRAVLRSERLADLFGHLARRQIGDNGRRPETALEPRSPTTAQLPRDPKS